MSDKETEAHREAEPGGFGGGIREILVNKGRQTLGVQGSVCD